MRRALKSTTGAIALSVLTAFGGPSAAVAESDTDSMTRVRVPAVGVALRIPSSWTVMPLNRAEASRLRRRLAKTDADFADFVVDNAEPDAQPENLKFRALDARGAYETGTGDGNVRIYLHEKRSFPDSVDELEAQFALSASALGATIDRAEAVDLDGSRAYRVDLVVPAGEQGGRAVPAVRLSRLILRRGHGDVSVDVTTLGSDSEIADAILGTVERN